MTTMVETEIRPFRVEFKEEQIDDLRRRIAATRWPSKELVQDRSQGVAGDRPGARALLGDRLRLAQSRSEVQRAAAVQDRDRRRRHPLHPREVEARGCAAADHDPRLAGLDHRTARGRRPADGPDRTRVVVRRGRLRPRPSLRAGLRLLGRADRARLVGRPSGAGLASVDGTASGTPAMSRRAGTWARSSPT